MKLKKYILLFILLVAYSGLAVGQPYENIEGYETVPKFPVDGYVILTSGDTVMGRFSDKKLNQFTYFISELTFDGPNGQETFTPNDIPGFGLKMYYDQDNHRFKSSLGQYDRPIDYPVKYVPFETRPDIKKGLPTFMMRVNDGKIVLFQNPKSGMSMYKEAETTTTTFQSMKVKIDPPRPIDSTFFDPRYEKLWKHEMEKSLFNIYVSYDVDITGGETDWSFGNYFLVSADGGLINLSGKNYEEQWDYMFGDCPVVANAVVADPDLKKFRKLMRLVMAYNAACN